MSYHIDKNCPGDNYRIDTLIGKGSFGKVYLAKEVGTEKKFAIKVFEKTEASEDDILRFEKEGQIMQILNHPHIVKFKELFHAGKKIYIVMEYLEGGTLLEFLESLKQTNEKLSDENASKIMIKILSAVKYLHLKGFTHRDIKPENILFAKSGDIHSVKLTDFGLCGEFGPYDKTFYQGCGTPLYFAPEFLNHGVYTKAVDIWGCGIILYMLCNEGAHPFYEENDTKQILFEKIKAPLKKFPPSFNPLARDLFLKMTQVEPSERFSIDLIERHPWIIREEKAAMPMSLIESLKAFSCQKQIINVILAINMVKYFQSSSMCDEENTQMNSSLIGKEELLIKNLMTISMSLEQYKNNKTLYDSNKDFPSSCSIKNITEKTNEGCPMIKLNFSDVHHNNDFHFKEFRIRSQKSPCFSLTTSPPSKGHSANFSFSNASNPSSSCTSPRKINLNLKRISSNTGIDSTKREANEQILQSTDSKWEFIEADDKAVSKIQMPHQQNPNSRQKLTSKLRFSSTYGSNFKNFKKKRGSLEYLNDQVCQEDNSSIIINKFLSPLNCENLSQAKKIIELKGFFHNFSIGMNPSPKRKKESYQIPSQFSQKNKEKTPKLNAGELCTCKSTVSLPQITKGPKK